MLASFRGMNLFQFDFLARATGRAGFGIAVAALVGVAAFSPANAQQTADLQELFRQVMLNPNDAAANIRYAKEAERRGELRKALSTYERMVLNNPNDSQARGEFERIKALLEPAETRFQVGFGGHWESNTNLDDGNGRSDFAGVVTLRMDDNRRFGSQLWRSSVQLYGDAHARTSSSDFLYGNATTGPMFLFENGWRIHTFVTAETGAADYDFLFWSAGVGGTIETRGTDPLRSVTAVVSYADFSKNNSSGAFSAESGRDAVVFGLSARLGWDNVFGKTDGIEVRPAFVYNNADKSQFTFMQAGVTLSYAISMFSFAGGVGNVYFNPEITAQFRDYDGFEPGRTKERTDIRLAPALRLIGMYDNFSAVLGYMYDRNFSNYNDNGGNSGRDYTNHRISLNFYVDF
ncbi:MAG: hypothetical protein K0S54_2332 [Alphaproteobacteria bacterium]|nr:hypothetical protein [Alphaproteobacteria bacterium]